MGTVAFTSTTRPEPSAYAADKDPGLFGVINDLAKRAFGPDGKPCTPGWSEERSTPGWKEERSTPGWKEERSTPGWKEERSTPGWKEERSTPGWKE